MTESEVTELPSSESIREYAKRTLNIGLAKRVDQLVFEMLMSQSVMSQSVMREYTKSDIAAEQVDGERG